MASVYTIEGPRRRRRKRRRKSKSSMTPHQRRFAKAAQQCSREVERTGRSFRACMRRKLKK